MIKIQRILLKIFTLLLLALFVFNIFPATGAFESPEMNWNAIYGGEGSDTVLQLIQTKDNGYASTGFSGSYRADGHDIWLVKITENGTIDWKKHYLGTHDNGAYDLIQTDDEGFALAGFLYISDRNYDPFLMKTNDTGDVEWAYSYGYSDEDRATSLIQTSNGFVLAGFTKTTNQNYDCLLIKTDSMGNTIWSKKYGGSKVEKAWSSVNTSDGGFALAGYTSSFGSGGFDFWLVKTDVNGTMEWNRTFGGMEDDVCHSLVQTSDGGFALAGYTSSFGSGGFDFWLVKTDVNGTMEWNRTFGGREDNVCRSLIQTSDYGFALTGYSEQTFFYDFFLVKTDYNGYMQWSDNYSGVGDAYAMSLIEASDEGFVMAGYIHFTLENTDGFILKTNKSIGGYQNFAPIANAGGDLTIIDKNRVLFSGTGYDYDGNITHYRWDFEGDGKYDYESNITSDTSYVYSKTGTYCAMLEVTDNNGSTSTDMRKIDVTSEKIIPEETQDGRQLVNLLITALLIGLILILFIFRKRSINISSKLPFLKNFKYFPKLNKYLYYLIFSFIIISIIKILLSFIFETPVIHNDEIIYGVTAGKIASGKIVVLADVPFIGVYPPAGYSYILSPAYFLSNKMDVIFHGMLIINCLITSLIIFPVFFIMRKFVDEKLSFVTSIIVVVLPTITIHNYILMSENAFVPMFLFSCFLIIKVFTYDKFDKKFLFYSLLAGFSVIGIIMIRAMGIAMLAALLCVFIYQLIKTRRLSTLNKSMVFFPFILFIIAGFIVFKEKILSFGYSGSTYLNNISTIFSDFSGLIRFIRIFLNEINYFVLMSYIIFFAFTIFLFIYWRKIQKDIKEPLKVFVLYSMFSIFFLIFITDIHVFGTDFNLYTRYVSAGLPIFFMLGVIGMSLFNKIKNKKTCLHISYIFILLLLFVILSFPNIKEIKLVNSLDLGWMFYGYTTFIHSITLYTLFQIIIGVFLILFTILILYLWYIRKNLDIIKNSFKKTDFILILIILLSLLICIPCVNIIYDSNRESIEFGSSKPAFWFMNNDPNANVIVEDHFAAYSGGGVKIHNWHFMYNDLLFWVPNGNFVVVNRYNLSEMIKTGDVNADYILSTHDLTGYYNSISDINMNMAVSSIKSQRTVDWHIYKVK